MSRVKLLYLQFLTSIFIFFLISQFFISHSMGALPIEYIPDSYIVVLNDDEDPQNVGDDMKQAYGMGFQLNTFYQYALKGFSTNIYDEVILDMVEQDSRVKYIVQNKKGYLLGLSTLDLEQWPAIAANNITASQSLSTLDHEQWLPFGICRIGADLHSYTKGKATDVDIAIMDSGIDLDHPDLNVISDVSFVPGIDSGDDDLGHGTHVAGIAAARNNGIGVVGTAPCARLHALKVGTADKWDSQWIIDAIEWVTERADEIEVVNMSLAWPGYNQALRDAIKKSVSKGVVYVVAAGNECMDIYGEDGIFGTDDDIEPASYPEVATISAMADSDGKWGGEGLNLRKYLWEGYWRLLYNMPDDTVATFSNFSNFVVQNNPVASPGGAIDLAAPGVNILSTYMGGKYELMDGTSMSSPLVAGCMALYIAEHGRAVDASGVEDIRQFFIDNAIPQSYWGAANIGDQDNQPEGLVKLGFDPHIVKITNPDDGATFKNNRLIIIQVRTSYNNWINDVEYSIDNGDYYNMNDIGDGYWEAEWDIHQAAKGDYEITILAEDRMDNQSTDSIEVSIKKEGISGGGGGGVGPCYQIGFGIWWCPGGFGDWNYGLGNWNYGFGDWNYGLGNWNYGLGGWNYGLGNWYNPPGIGNWYNPININSGYPNLGFSNSYYQFPYFTP